MYVLHCPSISLSTSIYIYISDYLFISLSTPLSRVIIDRVADSIVNEFENDDYGEEEDISDISDDEDGESSGTNGQIKRTRELIDGLVENAEGEEAFARILSDLSGYQPAVTTESSRKKSISLSMTNSSNSNSANLSAAKKRKAPLPTSGSRFNRLSALTQAMRTGIISDDEGGSGSGNNGNNQGNLNVDVTGSGHDNFISDDFEGEEAELAQLKKVRRGSLTGTPANTLNPQSSETPSKEDTTVYKVIPVQFDSEGNPTLPLSLNMITVHRLGEIVYDRPAYHSKRYILPVGFTTSRSYFSVLSPDSVINYYSTILDNGPTPLYQVTPEGHPEMTFQSASTTGAWAAVSKAAAAIRGKDSAPSVSGPDFFGLANPTVSMLIERLPNSDKCESYVPKKYEVSNLVGGKNVKRTTDVVNTTKANNNSTDDANNFDIHNSYM